MIHHAVSGLHQSVDLFLQLHWICPFPYARGKTIPCYEPLCGENSFKICQGTNTAKLFCHNSYPHYA